MSATQTEPSPIAGPTGAEPTGADATSSFVAGSIRTSELERAEGRLGSLSPSERRAVESLTAQIVNKLLHAPTVRMKQAAAAADGVLYADAVRHLFDLDDRDSSARQPGE